ncbi:non-heme iron oxygenase ferredoxin subunit [Halieaceae bacterium IMCC14734]|uniref:Non-heme iron oxygenase ferredoxin subunit n=1 Tax=Candidatus Litorirhabdus singularis TaxID=2518993 RepID=A0ABT3TI30_9GAMM|nr:non-heme iron oxygenase ferredoxin subunit [Candidatus Litorirhabdus singularis]MCX2981936.1 non-heme iron oxygenase ferredoxin subunit [Candidatus Litorirhabdus singularis]
MSDSNYTVVARTEALPAKSSLRVELKGHDILLCHIEAGIFAVTNLCSHAEAQLHEGKLKGHKILCPLHGAAFDVRDGTALTRPATKPLCSYRVKVLGDDILIELPETN